ncbi:hypothetical protein SDC9_154105 [bioreactor metagenome]|uniref:Uncharacterized protein n=1 Tax=bioreactor metagenome TaxID=1076179 RepID=A0A645EXS1_9ZZZZ
MQRTNLLQPSFQRHDAAVQQADFVADALNVRQNVRGEQHGRFPLDFVENVDDLLAPRGIERGGRLVADQQFRAVDQRLRNAEALFHAARKAADAPVRSGLETNEREQFAAAPLQLAVGHARNLPAEAKVLARREVAVEFRNVRQVAHVSVRFGLSITHRFAADADFAAVRREQAENQLHAGRLARTVFADETVDRMLRHAEREIAQHRLAAKALGDMVEFEYIHRRLLLIKRERAKRSTTRIG